MKNQSLMIYQTSKRPMIDAALVAEVLKGNYETSNDAKVDGVIANFNTEIANTTSEESVRGLCCGPSCLTLIEPERTN